MACCSSSNACQRAIGGGAFGSIALMSVASKDGIDERYADPINHSRLFQNLNQLTDQDHINRDDLDARANVYTLTDAGRQLLQRHAESLAGLCGLPQPVAGGAQ
ncbi:MarR family winged helix-turn-helix transcriptional regulator [Haloarcula sp. 1CSR25-25]|nr:MarR family winged helix-turn-helix transcriptional regulator [Haloarcula sp. 1CSR25-25]